MSALLVTASLFAQPSTPAPLKIDGLGKGTAPLDGAWQFHPGDDPDGSLGWASPALNDSLWESIRVDQPWGAQPGHEAQTGYAWYRRHIALSSAPGTSPQLALMIRQVDDAYELYWNGILIGRNGSFPPHPAWYNDQAPQTFGLGTIVDRPAGTDNLLALRVWKAPLLSYDTGDQGGLQQAPVIGSPEAIAAEKAALDYRWLRGRQFTFALDCLYALVALLSMLAWLRDRRQTLLIWMVGFSLAPLAVLLLDGLRLLWPFHIALALQQPLYSLEDISLWYILLWILRLKDSRKIVRWVTLAAAINITTSVLDGLVAYIGWSTGNDWNHHAQLADATLTVLLTATEILPLCLVSIAAVFAFTRRQHLDFSRWFVAIAAFLTILMSFLQTAAAQGSRFTHWKITARIAAPLFTLNGNPIAPYTLFRTLLVSALIYAVYRYYVETGQRKNSLEQELQSVRELQQVLIPNTPPSVPGFTLTGAYRPAQEVGGDFFQIIPVQGGARDGGSTLIILGDVSGKGLKAAMAVAVILGALRALAPFFTDPALLLGELNQSLFGRLQGAFATCIILRVDRDGRCLIASAGHPSPFLNDQELALPGALPLALAGISSYEDTAVALNVDDRLALYTDGLLEARNPSGELYSFDRLQQLFAKRPTAEEATEAAVDFGQDDDITVLTITRRPSNYREPLSAKALSETQTIRLYPAS